jgi:hypothetical protein
VTANRSCLENRVKLRVTILARVRPDEERTTITSVIDALIIKAKLRLITGRAG